MQLTEENFKLACAKHYDSIDVHSFNEDIARVYMVRKMIRKYIMNQELNERLLLNHLIILYNGFGEFASDILYFVFEEHEHKYINSFLLFLNRLPEQEYGSGIDINITKRLEQI